MCIAFSGGVDSALLLKAADNILSGNVIAVTAVINSMSDREYGDCIEFCREHGIKHIICKVNELEIEGFADNPKNRCYLCKRALLKKIISEAQKHGFECVAEGSNVDDLSDYRPGMAAVKELKVISPLQDAGFTKGDIRKLSKELGLKTWNKPSFACLSSRIPYGEAITIKKLEMIKAAEAFLFERGYNQVRIRVHNNLARIELLSEDIERAAAEDERKHIYDYLKQLGFIYVTIDLLGYRTGSMNEGNIL